jgi:hypothetical protein
LLITRPHGPQGGSGDNPVMLQLALCEPGRELSWPKASLPDTEPRPPEKKERKKKYISLLFSGGPRGVVDICKSFLQSELLIAKHNIGTSGVN